MLRWLLLGGLLFALVSGVRNGWVELRWDRLLHDAGVPFVPDPGRPLGPADRSQAGAAAPGSGPGPAAGRPATEAVA